MTGLLALVIGADRPRGPEIVAQLRADGFDVALETAAHGRLDVLVVNSPVDRAPIRFRDMAEDAFRTILEMQLYEMVAASQFAVPHINRGGSIVQVTAASHLGSWDGVHAASAVAAAIAMARSMALELAPLGIRVNSLAPDPVEGAPADAREVAAAVAWLAGPASSLVTGETILLNQGRSLKMGQAARR